MNGQGRHVATIPLWPWIEEAVVMAPLECISEKQGSDGRPGDIGEGSANLHGQLITWSEDDR